MKIDFVIPVLFSKFTSVFIKLMKTVKKHIYKRQGFMNAFEKEPEMTVEKMTPIKHIFIQMSLLHKRFVS